MCTHVFTSFRVFQKGRGDVKPRLPTVVDCHNLKVKFTNMKERKKKDNRSAVAVTWLLSHQKVAFLPSQQRASKHSAISVSEISRFFDLENARLKMDDLEISRDLEIGQ